MNTFGRNFRCTTFGESHGKALGVVIDGCPSGIEFSEEDIIPFLNRRRTGQSKTVSSRNESDKPEILSGVFSGKTTGTPIAVIVRNENQDSGAYEDIKDLYRPGHADFTYDARYGMGIRDWRGGGRSSGRETISRVIAGALATKILSMKGISFKTQILSIHGETNSEKFESVILSAKENGDSVGGVVELRINGVNAGLGSPVAAKLDAELAGALVSIGAVKAVEIGDGFSSADKFGSENNDSMNSSGFATNHSGGVLGGISNGNEIVVRFAVKPTPSIKKEQDTVDRFGNERKISVIGRHDPCIVPRILVIAECMAAIVILDAYLDL